MRWDAWSRGFAGHDRAGLDHLDEAMEACQERDEAERRVRELEGRQAKLRELATNGYTYADYVPVVTQDELLAILDNKGEPT